MNPKSWQGRDDKEESDFAGRWHQYIAPVGQAPGIALLGFASDEGVARNFGRQGAAEGPTALRKMLANLPLTRPTDRLYDAGDVHCQQHQLEQAQYDFAQSVNQLTTTGHRVIGLGGGHEIAFASFTGLFQSLQQQNLSTNIGIINFDAHLDLRMSDKATSGTPFRQIAEFCQDNGAPFNYFCVGASKYANTQALFQRARDLQVKICLDEHIAWNDLNALKQELQLFAASKDALYVTCCLDVFPAADAPGVSAPAALGVHPAIVEQLLDTIMQTQRVMLFDIAELNPRFDIDNRTARLAARLVARVADFWLVHHE